MNKIKNNLTFFIIFTFILLIFKYNFILNKSVIDGVNLWLNKVFPSLFIMFIINDLIINLNILDNINKYLSPLFNKLFKTCGNSSIAFLLSIFSGTPSSAYIIKEMINSKNISIEDANKLISFTFFSNPLFLYNILSLSFNKFITIKIILIHYISNIFIGLIFRNKDTSSKIIYNHENKTKTNVFLLIPMSIKKSFDTLLMILGTIVFYMILSNLIIYIIPLSDILNVIVKGILEITQSLIFLPNININSLIKEIIAISIISFGGFSIHTQMLSILSDTEVKYKNFFIGRVLQALISTITYLFLYFCIPS